MDAVPGALGNPSDAATQVRERVLFALSLSLFPGWSHWLGMAALGLAPVGGGLFVLHTESADAVRCGWMLCGCA